MADESLPTTEFCKNLNIDWFPINLTISGKNKKLNEIDHSLYNFSRPNLHDFSDKNLLKARQHLFRTHPELFTHLCIDTTNVFQIDIDKEDYQDEFDCIARVSPWFPSMTKSYGKHIFCRYDGFLPSAKRMQFLNYGEPDGVELLCGVGSYAPFVIQNTGFPIYDLKLNTYKVTIDVPKQQPTQQPKQRQQNLKKEVPKTDNQFEKIKALCEIIDDKYICLKGCYDDWRNILWALRSESEDYKELAREMSNRRGANFDDGVFDSVWGSFKEGKITIGTFYTYCKKSDSKRYAEILEEFPSNKLDEGRDYESVKKEFEKTHLLIRNKAYFIRETENDNIILTKKELITSTERISYDVVVKDEIKQKCFINDWLKDDTNRIKDDIGTYPPDCKCPDNIFNLWHPFEMEKITTFEKDETAIQTIKTHIKIMCGNEENVANHFELWIAQMIQFPSVKTICPTLISDEGAGKGTLMRLFEKMFGKNKILQTQEPSKHVWGNFNGPMKNAFLVNLDELSKKEAKGADGYIKGLITEPRLLINEKNVNAFEIASYHRFFGTSNKEDPVQTSKNDRRNWIIRSSDELINNKEYFEKIHEMLNDVNAVKSIYEYFKMLPGARDFNKIPFPVTEYQINIKQKYLSPIELWLRQFTEDNCDTDHVEKSSAELFENFNLYKINAKLEKFECSIISFGVQLTNLKIDGVGDIIKTKTNNKRSFDISRMKKHFGMGCLLQSI